MQNIESILGEYGIKLPEDKKTEINKKISENYVTKAEADKKDAKISRLTSEKNDYKTRAETAESTLSDLGDVEDLKTLRTQVADWKKKAETAENDFNAKLHERDYADAVNAAIGEYKFTSEAAKRDVIAQIKRADLKLNDGKLLGLNDLIEQIKSNDESAFVDEQQQNLENNRTKVVTRNDVGGDSRTYKSKDDILAIKDGAERRRAIADNMDLFSQKE